MKRFKSIVTIIAVAIMAIVVFSSCTSESAKNAYRMEGKKMAHKATVAYAADSIKSNLYCINVTAYDKKDSIIYIAEHYVVVADKANLPIMEDLYTKDLYKFGMTDSVIVSHWKVDVE